ncbi:TPA: hypothetical protein ACUNF5_005240 [Burkholderia orbicola]
MKKITSILLMVACASFARESAAQEVYTRQGDLLVAAIKAGSASGEMRGPVAELFTRQFRSQGPLLVSAKVIRALRRDGCKRLEMTFTKKDVETPKGVSDAVLKTELNYCADGAPPIGLE